MTHPTGMAFAILNKCDALHDCCVKIKRGRRMKARSIGKSLVFATTSAGCQRIRQSQFVGGHDLAASDNRITKESVLFDDHEEYDD